MEILSQSTIRNADAKHPGASAAEPPSTPQMEIGLLTGGLIDPMLTDWHWLWLQRISRWTSLAAMKWTARKCIRQRSPIPQRVRRSAADFGMAAQGTAGAYFYARL